MSEDRTTYDDLRTAILGALDRDGTHNWDETSRLADLIAPKVWNLLLVCPLDAEAGPPVIVEGEAVEVAPPERRLPPPPDPDHMCPNCVTPWKCNGPHVAGA